MVEVIAFDGDDTLWHSEAGFVEVQEAFHQLCAPYIDPADRAGIDAELYRTEAANMATFGYGVKAFTLSMVETAVRVSDGAIPASKIAAIVEAGKDLLNRPVELCDGAAEAVDELAADHRLLLLTKGDLLHQERKIADSKLADHFDRVQIVSEKDAGTYRRVMQEEELGSGQLLMVGNSLRSDILPALEAGAHAVHVPYQYTWVHEQVSTNGREDIVVLDSLKALPEHVQELRRTP